jgi:hypothetical protein
MTVGGTCGLFVVLYAVLNGQTECLPKIIGIVGDVGRAEDTLCLTI